MKANVNGPNTNDPLLYLDPNDILEPEVTNVRPYSSTHGDTEEEIAAIEALMRSIADEGQIAPGKVVKIQDAKEGEPQFALVAGRRRRRAILMHNLALGEGKPPLMFAAVLSESDLKPPQLFRQAAHENLQRAGLSPMDFAVDIKIVREKYKWNKAGGTKKVAEFFEVSPAQITEHEKLNALPEDVQAKVHSGEISRADAFKLVRIMEKETASGGDGAAVASAVASEAMEAGRSVERAAEELTALSNEAEHSVVEAGAGVDAAEETAVGTGKKKGAGKGGKKTTAPKTKKAAAVAKTKVIREKLREVEPGKTARSKKEILEFFAGCRGPAYGHPNGAVHQFVDNLMKYAAGEIQDRTLEKYFDAMVDKAAKGSPAPAVKEPVDAAAGKSTTPAPKSTGKKKAAKKK